MRIEKAALTDGLKFVDKPSPQGEADKVGDSLRVALRRATQNDMPQGEAETPHHRKRSFPPRGSHAEELGRFDRKNALKCVIAGQRGAV